ncbi:helix-turn-helix domain-containing protein [Dinghuibacter silviterrae]|uniref:Helix-turn-helix protein n=1 Tax=Dinghuibacter silviterrae TaxID=1539049 RepID=A0A4R8DTR3_9BACT|nr:helix-turn-helix protein [Dinghuibacter silviterrae]
MEIELVTTADLEEFRVTLLKDLEAIIKASRAKKWLRTNEVLEVLGISEVTLRTLRNKGVIPFRKIGNVCYYSIEEVNEAIGKSK